MAEQERERKARMSAQRRAQRPVPATREEADELFRPRAGGNAKASAYGTRLCRLNELGLLALRAAPGVRISNLEAHEAILECMYPTPDEP